MGGFLALPEVVLVGLLGLEVAGLVTEVGDSAVIRGGAFSSGVTFLEVAECFGEEGGKGSGVF